MTPETFIQTELRVLNWNVAGAKYFAVESDDGKEKFRTEVNDYLAELVRRYDPHVVALQETVVVGRPGEARISLVTPPSNYALAQTTLIDSERHPYVAKWRKVEHQGKWPAGTYFGQGLGMLWKTSLPQFRHFPVWRIPGLEAEPDGAAHVEEVVLMSGLYFGDRNTEPRAALVAHFVVTHDLTKLANQLAKPLDVFVVNVHLTTLKHEREGVPAIDEEAAQLRSHQLDIILSGIVSRYNQWRSAKYQTSGEPPQTSTDDESSRYSPVWVLCGDFNFTPESLEYNRVQRANFVDVCPNKAHGTKASGFGGHARLAVDHIFAGPKFVSLDPVVLDEFIKKARTPEYWVTVSDHYPIFAEVPLTPH